MQDGIHNCVSEDKTFTTISFIFTQNPASKIDVTATTATLTWTTTTDATYTFDWGAGSGDVYGDTFAGYDHHIDGNTPAKTQTVTITGLSPIHYYYYRVVATRYRIPAENPPNKLEWGSLSQSQNVRFMTNCTFIKDYSISVTPGRTNFNGGNAVNTYLDNTGPTATISWESADNINGFVLYGGATDTPDGKVNFTGPGPNYSVVLTNLQPSARYQSEHGYYSNVYSFSIQPNMPDGTSCAGGWGNIWLPLSNPTPLQSIQAAMINPVNQFIQGQNQPIIEGVKQHKKPIIIVIITLIITLILLIIIKKRIKRIKQFKNNA